MSTCIFLIGSDHKSCSSLSCGCQKAIVAPQWHIEQQIFFFYSMRIEGQQRVKGQTCLWFRKYTEDIHRQTQGERHKQAKAFCCCFSLISCPRTCFDLHSNWWIFKLSVDALFFLRWNDSICLPLCCLGKVISISEVYVRPYCVSNHITVDGDGNRPISQKCFQFSSLNVCVNK